MISFVSSLRILCISAELKPTDKDRDRGALLDLSEEKPTTVTRTDLEGGQRRRGLVSGSAAAAAAATEGGAGT